MPDKVYLRSGRERSVLLGHPWVFSGAVGRIEGAPASGAVVDVLDHCGNWLAFGAFAADSEIHVRLLSRRQDDVVDGLWMRRRLFEAAELRSRLCIESSSNSFRLVYAESDGLPGLIVDRYADLAVVQSQTAWGDAWVALLAQCLVEDLGFRAVYERSDTDVREREGLAPRWGWLYGTAETETVIQENGLSFFADLAGGQKTGFYLDQRVNRKRAAAYCREGNALNAFSYSGAFGVYLRRGGAASVTNIDSSAAALELARRNAAANDVLEGSEFVEGNVFEVLRAYRDRGKAFSSIILDPPKLAFGKSSVPKACRAYKDVNLLALKLLRPGGILVTFSCSGPVSRELFDQVVFAASVDAHREVRILERLSQPPDHPALASFPESEYLKGLICQVQ